MAHESDIFVPQPTQTTRTLTNIPGFEDLRRQVGGRLDEFLADPLGSRLFGATIGPQLAALVPSEELATRNLTDLFRRSGGGTLQSGAFADAARRLQGDIVGKRSNLIASQANQTLNTLMRGLGLNIDLLRSLRPTDVTTSQTSNVPARLSPITAGTGSFSGFGASGGLGFSPETRRVAESARRALGFTAGGGGGGGSSSFVGAEAGGLSNEEIDRILGENEFLFRPSTVPSGSPADDAFFDPFTDTFNNFGFGEEIF